MPESVIDDDYIQLCIDEMNAIAEASQQLLMETWSAGEEPRYTREQQDRRRAELYRQYLDAAGIAIVRLARS